MALCGTFGCDSNILQICKCKKRFFVISPWLVKMACAFSEINQTYDPKGPDMAEERIIKKIARVVRDGDFRGETITVIPVRTGFRFLSSPKVFRLWGRLSDTYPP